MVMTDHLIQRRPPAGRPARRNSASVRPRNTTARSCRTTLRRCRERPRTRCTARVAQVGLGNNLAGRSAAFWRAKSRGRSPREPEFYIVLGDAWQSAGKPREAVAAYEQAVRLNAEIA